MVVSVTVSSSSKTRTSLEVGRDVISKEAAALSALADCLDASFAQAVELIRNHSGHIILSGVGKSGLIARKVTSTLCSTGTPAIFMHAADAVHGDLGIVRPQDPVILFSKSGATGELVRLLPTLKSQGNPLVAIVGNTGSPLAAEADYVLSVGIAAEADPLGIVPTTSALVMLAMGDALASALMVSRGFSSNEFARFHPAGQLGRNLLLRVSEVMNGKGKVAVVYPETTVRELVILMTRYPLGAACVEDHQGRLVGLVTDGDLRRGLERVGDILDLPCGELMTISPVHISEHAALGEALTLMEDRPRQISVLPVVTCEEKMACVGLLRLHDIYQPYLI